MNRQLIDYERSLWAPREFRYTRRHPEPHRERYIVPVSKMSMVGVATVSLLASSGVLAEASYPETIRLVRSMREDEMIMVGLQAKFA